ncbi:hypothetical protein [Paraburkholderia aspalathi]|uniref:hypothetical protein n=1 Tax=Paraburkholderia aspalathi TaxID=1324617 RepID=UPI0038BCA981
MSHTTAQPLTAWKARRSVHLLIWSDRHIGSSQPAAAPFVHRPIRAFEKGGSRVRWFSAGVAEMFKSRSDGQSVDRITAASPAQKSRYQVVKSVLSHIGVAIDSKALVRALTALLPSIVLTLVSGQTEWLLVSLVTASTAKLANINNSVAISHVFCLGDVGERAARCGRDRLNSRVLWTH